MRVHFELRYGVDTIDQAREIAHEKIAKFLDVNESAVPALVDMELKISNVDPEKDKHITHSLVATAYANVKHSIAKPF